MFTHSDVQGEDGPFDLECSEGETLISQAVSEGGPGPDWLLVKIVGNYCCELILYRALHKLLLPLCGCWDLYQRNQDHIAEYGSNMDRMKNNSFCGF
jgi:hypothetical protein